MRLPEIKRLHLTNVTLPQTHPLAGDTCSVYAYLILHPDGPVLVDTGVGSGHDGIKQLYRPIGRPLEDALRDNGVGPHDVTAVINTHLHFDHAGGNTLIADGKPVPAFPRARYLIPKGEWQSAASPNERTRATYLAENFEPLEDARQVELVEGEVEIVRGLSLVPAPGHTADHCIVELDTGGELALYVGELAQHPVMLERIAWISAFDVLPLVSLETKKHVIERALERRALIVSVHAPYPGLGRLRLEDGKRRWEPLDGPG